MVFSVLTKGRKLCIFVEDDGFAPPRSCLLLRVRGGRLRPAKIEISELLAEVSGQQTCEGLAVSGLVAVGRANWELA